MNHSIFYFSCYITISYRINLVLFTTEVATDVVLPLSRNVRIRPLLAKINEFEGAMSHFQENRQILGFCANVSGG